MNFFKYDVNNINIKREVYMEKDIKVVNGDGSDLEISPVYKHLEVEKPKEEPKKENIVIPQEKK